MRKCTGESSESTPVKREAPPSGGLMLSGRNSPSHKPPSMTSVVPSPTTRSVGTLKGLSSVYLYHLYRCRSLFLSSNATLLLASAGGRTVTLRRTLRTGDELCRARAWPAPPPGHPRTPTWPRQSRLCERSELFPSTAAPLPPSSGQGATAACGLESSASASHDSCE